MVWKRTSVAVTLSFMMLAAVACGGGGSSSGEDASEAFTGGMSDEAIAEASGVSVECVEAARAYAALAAIPSMLTSGGSDQEVADLEEAIADLGNNVPAELQDAFAVVEPVFEAFLEIFGDFSMEQIATDPDAMARFEELDQLTSDPEVEAAFDELNTYFDVTCGEGY
jgi:ABC-type glycerol-3-phosphate transport system substrate-binding protein